MAKGGDTLARTYKLRWFCSCFRFNLVSFMGVGWQRLLVAINFLVSGGHSVNDMVLRIHLLEIIQ